MSLDISWKKLHGSGLFKDFAPNLETLQTRYDTIEREREREREFNMD